MDMDIKEQNQKLAEINAWLMKAIHERDRTIDESFRIMRKNERMINELIETVKKRDQLIERLMRTLELSRANTKQANMNCFLLNTEIERLRGEEIGGHC